MSIPSTFQRAKARLIDELICLVLSLPVTGHLFLTEFNEDADWNLPWTGLFYWAGIRLFYFYVSYRFFQKTLGKWVYDLRLVPAANYNAELTDSQILLRLVAEWFKLPLSWSIYSIMFFRYDRRHFADLVAETRVAGPVQARPTTSRRTKIRWIVGIILLFSVFSGLKSTGEFVALLEWNKEFLFIY